jgi:hypothetical protein
MALTALQAMAGSGLAITHFIHFYRVAGLSKMVIGLPFLELIYSVPCVRGVKEALVPFAGRLPEPERVSGNLMVSCPLASLHTDNRPNSPGATERGASVQRRARYLSQQSSLHILRTLTRHVQMLQGSPFPLGLTCSSRLTYVLFRGLTTRDDRFQKDLLFRFYLRNEVSYPSTRAMETFWPGYLDGLACARTSTSSPCSIWKMIASNEMPLSALSFSFFSGSHA